MSDHGPQPLCYTSKVGDSARQTGVSQAMEPISGAKRCKAPWDELAAVLWWADKVPLGKAPSTVARLLNTKVSLLLSTEGHQTGGHHAQIWDDSKPGRLRGSVWGQHGASQSPACEM